MCSNKKENSHVLVPFSFVILDIEGTTTSISFVKDVLFPYVRKHLSDYVQKMWKFPSFEHVVESLRAQAKVDRENNIEGVVAIPETGDEEYLMKAVTDNVIWQMSHDRKTKSLKDLQGLIMEEGYKIGELKGHLYEDVEPSLREWTKNGKSIYIYSSGSIYAQKLLFGHTDKGNLLPLIEGHFDTTVGMKGEPQSYKNILQKISCDASEVVFLTDIPKEAKAAKAAGVTAILLSREGNAPLTEEDVKEFPVVTSFNEIVFENNKNIKPSGDCNVLKDNKEHST